VRTHKGFTVVLVGFAAGLILAVLSTRIIAAFLYGLSPADSLSIGVAVMILIGISLLACLLPARRAAKVDPMISLRHD
jgi:ABC-type antimicrobial peptide transport system permease subunit